MFEVGDEIISIKRCGCARKVPVGTKGIIHSIRYDTEEIFCSFNGIKGFKICGTTYNPRIDLYNKSSISNKRFKKINVKFLFKEH